MICADTGIARGTCYCANCWTIRDEVSQLRLKKAALMVAEVDDERQREQELYHLDLHLRELARELA